MRKTLVGRRLRNDSVPFHEARLDQQLGQVLADGAGRTHHELQNDLPALHGIAVEALDVPGMTVRAQNDALICPYLTPVGDAQKSHNTCQRSFFLSDLLTTLISFRQRGGRWGERTRPEELSSGYLWRLDSGCIPADPPAAADCATNGGPSEPRHIRHDPWKKKPNLAAAPSDPGFSTQSASAQAAAEEKTKKRSIKTLKQHRSFRLSLL